MCAVAVPRPRQSIFKMAIIKVKGPNAVRKLAIENALLGYNELKKVATEEFGNIKFVITYVDEDNDKISVKTREDLAIALSENVKLFTVHPEDENRNIELLPPNTTWDTEDLCHARGEGRESKPENAGDDGEHRADGDDDGDDEHQPPQKKRKEKGKFLSWNENVMKKFEKAKLCTSLSKEHEKEFGLPCLYKLVEEHNKMSIYCPFCDDSIQVTKCAESQAKQKIGIHQQRICHRSNVFNCSPQEMLKGEKFVDVQIAEASAKSLIQSLAPGEMKFFRKESGKLFVQCQICGPASKMIAVIPKGTEFASSLSNHLSSEAHVKAKKNRQSYLTSYFPSSSQSSEKPADKE